MWLEISVCHPPARTPLPLPHSLARTHLYPAEDLEGAGPCSQHLYGACGSIPSACLQWFMPQDSTSLVSRTRRRCLPPCLRSGLPLESLLGGQQHHVLLTSCLGASQLSPSACQDSAPSLLGVSVAAFDSWCTHICDGKEGSHASVTASYAREDGGEVLLRCSSSWSELWP